jgi:hypothetical protein
MNSLARNSYWLLCLLVIAGCQSADKPVSASNAAVEKPAAVAATTKAASATAPTPTLANPKVTSAAAEFKPPFAERELFETPKNPQGMVRRDDEKGEAVVLKGFINVDQPRAVLSIGGVIAAIPEGGEKYGVHVISIQPPKATLQRGRNRWPATLE